MRSQYRRVPVNSMKVTADNGLFDFASAQVTQCKVCRKPFVVANGAFMRAGYGQVTIAVREWTEKMGLEMKIAGEDDCTVCHRCEEMGGVKNAKDAAERLKIAAHVTDEHSKMEKRFWDKMSG